MPPIRLNNDKRRRLQEYAARSLDCPKERQAELESYARTFALVLRELDALVVPEVRGALFAWGRIRAVSEVSVMMSDSVTSTTYTFCSCVRDVHRAAGSERCHRRPGDRDAVFAMPVGNGNGRWAREGLLLGDVPKKMRPFINMSVHDNIRAAILKHAIIEEAHTEARQKVLSAAFTVIDNSRTFQDVVTQWPAAEAMRVALGGYIEDTDAANTLANATILKNGA